MLSLTYTSVASAALAEDDIAAILLKSRANNRREGVTGALAYKSGRFVQILEGPDAVVRSRFEVIAADSRHRGVRIIREIQVPERQFAEWTMGFRKADSDIGSQLPGYEDVPGNELASRIALANDEAQQYLASLGEPWLPRSR
jgi:hypothetical protein